MPDLGRAKQVQDIQKSIQIVRIIRLPSPYWSNSIRAEFFFALCQLARMAQASTELVNRTAQFRAGGYIHLVLSQTGVLGPAVTRRYWPRRDQAHQITVPKYRIYHVLVLWMLQFTYDLYY